VPAEQPGTAVRVGRPVDLAGSLDVFRRSGDDLLDRWDGRVWLRTLAQGGRTVGVAARPAGTVADPALLVTAEDGADPAAAGRALAAGFVTAPDALAELAAADPVVARIAARFPGVGPVLQPDLLTAVVRSISAQQITLRFAAVLRGRLARRYGHRHQLLLPQGVWTATNAPSDRRLPSQSWAPHSLGEADRCVGGEAVGVPGEADPGVPGEADPGVPGEAGSGAPGEADLGAVTTAGLAGAEVWSLDAERLAGAAVAELRELQFSTSKAVAVVAFADAVAGGRVGLGELAGLPDEEVIGRLVTFPGIGRWTAEWLLARTLGRPRVVAGDLGVRKAVGAAYLGGRMPSEAEVRAATANWGPAAGVAQQLLLHWLSVEAPGRGGPRRPATGSRSATRPGRSSRRG
jgi:3-methyladenine DNA glycosylase/8-oxoguanine DNA glycosylase